jgi:diguanylate cyclase (GGDEF)-like protein
LKGGDDEVSGSGKLAEVRSILHFISEISTLYQVEPGPEFRLVDSNARAQILGSGPESFYGKLLREFTPHGYYKDHILPRFRQAVEGRTAMEFSDPPPFPTIHTLMEFHFTPILNDAGECTHIWVISRYKPASEDLEYLAFHDSLTSLPNRLAFAQRLNKSVSRYKQHRIPFAVMVIDCDNFKWVNDSFGHETGDLLLAGLASEIGSCLRQQDILARVGGDEFAVLLEDCDSGPAEGYAQAIRERAERDWDVKGERFRTTVSIGVAHSTEGNVDEILALADKALYKVKSTGRNSYAVTEDGR